MSRTLMSRRSWLQHRASSDESSASEDSAKLGSSHKGSYDRAVSGQQQQQQNSPSPSASGQQASQRPLSGTYSMSSSSTTAGGVRLAQEIHDEFLVCKICLDQYKSPKCLSCLHTFCEQCIENHVNSESSYKKYSDYREFTCPLCRKRTQLPVGGVKKLPDNFLVSSLTEVVSRQKPSKYPFCDICKMISHKHREASSKCLDCAKLLCSNCVQLHRDTKVTSGHSIFDVEIEKEVECKEHQDEVVRFYCERCDACVCVMCTFNEHKDHEIMHFGEAVTKYKDNIQRLMERCKEKIDKFDSQIDSLNKCEDILKTVEQKVHDAAIQHIQDIRNREKQIVEELQNMYGPECIDQLANKKELVVQVDSLRSTCSLTEVILTGKDIELLLLKRDVQEKLDSLSAINIRNLPATMSKVVEFVPGSVDLGYIHDYDRPLLSKMRPRRANTTDNLPLYNSMAVEAGMSTAETQTDPGITKLKTRSKNRKKSGSSSSSDSDSSSDSSDSDSDSEKEDKTKKPELIEAGIQTEKPEDSSSDSDSDSDDDDKPEKVETGTMTDDLIKVEEKAINTRSQGIPTTAPMVNNSASLDSSEDDNSLAARRRRRRERAQTTYIGQSGNMADTDGYNFGSSQEDNQVVPCGMSLAERRRMRTAYAMNHHSVDGEEVYYDAIPNGGPQKHL